MSGLLIHFLVLTVLFVLGRLLAVRAQDRRRTRKRARQKVSTDKVTPK